MTILLRLRNASPFLLVAAVGLYLFTVANAFDFPARPGRAGPDLWPKIVLALMLFASAWGALQALLSNGDDEEMSLLVKAATQAVGREEEARQDLGADSMPLDQRQPWRSVAAIAALLLFVGGIPYVGFTVACALLMFAIMLLAGYRRPLVAAFISVCGSLLFFIVFQKVAYISLPLGAGPFKDLSTGLMAVIGVR